MTNLLFAGVLLAKLLSGVDGYPRLQQQIPNGDKVMNPCDSSSNWKGVGHRNLNGGGDLNPFGLDFYANNLVWNASICRKDSDGDGMTNGEELGDPNCVWTPGSIPTSSMAWHPGICEPTDSAKCRDKNSWLMNCNSTKFNCPSTKESGVKNYTLRFPVTPVPTNETTYICTNFKLPNDTNADIIAIEPVIDNVEIIHHILLFGCTEEPMGPSYNEPYMCGMGSGMACLSLIGLWGAGAMGQCLYDKLGFRIGPGGLQYAVMQVHWNNPMHKKNLTDSSGLKIYYTSNLRPNPGEIVMIGQNYLEIPPSKTNVTFFGQCSSSCTKDLPHSIFITSAILHMHLLGRSGSMRLYRGQELVTVFEDVDKYDYNTPVIKEFKTPIEVKPGDRIGVKCVYDSTGKNTTTYQGEATSDEMCYAFFAYYPQIKGYSFCGQWKDLEICGHSNMYYNQCDLPSFLKNFLLIPSLCSQNCSDPNCMTTVRAALMTGCSRFDTVRKFSAGFFPQHFSHFAYCSLAVPTDMECTSPKNRLGFDMSTMSSYCPPMQSQSYGFVLFLVLALNANRSFW